MVYFCQCDDDQKFKYLFMLTSLPKLQELDLDFANCKLLAEDGVRNNVPTAFLCLKTLTVSQVDFTNNPIITFVYELIRCSPNLHKLMIEAKDGNDVPRSVTGSPNLDIYPVGQLQLRIVLFPAGRGLDSEVRFIKTLLASSPFLEKMDVHPSWSLKSVENLRFTKKLLKLHRASPTAEIDFY